ncbi:hypothetical protein SALBM217S_04359 [Streptomyces griseoloalbus]
MVVGGRGPAVLDRHGDVDLPGSRTIGRLASPSASCTRMRMPGAVAESRATAGATTCAMPVAKAATVTVPASPAPYAASSASARSSWARTALAWLSRISPGGGQPYAPGAALDQAVAGLLLQRGELLGDGRGGEVQRGGRRGDRAMVRHRTEDVEPPRFDHGIDCLKCSGARRSGVELRTGRDEGVDGTVHVVRGVRRESCTRMRAWPCGTTG